MPGIYSGTFVIPNGQQASNELSLTQGFMLKPVRFCIMAPATLLETVEVQVAPAVGGTYRSLVREDGTNADIAAGKAYHFDVIAGAIRLYAESGAVAGERTFDYSGSKQA
jgi:hypothetical protein